MYRVSRIRMVHAEIYDCGISYHNSISRMDSIDQSSGFLYDINYMPRMDSAHLALMDPFNRTRIRDSNRKNPAFNEKYVKNDLFDIKKFIFHHIENLFLTNKARALGEGLRRMLCIGQTWRTQVCNLLRSTHVGFPGRKVPTRIPFRMFRIRAWMNLEEKRCRMFAQNKHG